MSRIRSPQQPGNVRIIGGRWRGRRMAVPLDADARPTPDRVRETLFNWLQPVIEGMRCLDLFAGTGVLGVEALSRGAPEAWFVEENAAAATALEATLEKLDCADSTVIVGDALAFLKSEPTPFDLVFVDPPFGSLDLENLCTLLEEGWLSSGAYVYLEHSKRIDLPVLPVGWDVVREKTAGDVRFALAQRSRATDRRNEDTR